MQTDAIATAAPPIDDDFLLLPAARFYLAVARPGLKGLARRALDIALSMSAEDDATRHFDQVKAMAAEYPPVQRESLINALHELSGNYVDDMGRRARLYSIPVLIFTDQPTADLTHDEVSEIYASLRGLALFDDDVDVQLLPWLTCAPPYSDNPVARRRLVQELTDASAEEEMIRTMLGCSRSPLNMSDRIVRVAETVPDIEPGVPCVRYLTLAIVTEHDSPDATMRGLRLDTGRSRALDLWLKEIGLIVQQGGYQSVAVHDPVRICEVRPSGAIGVLGAVIAEARDAVTEMVQAHGHPEACQLVIQPCTDANRRLHSIRLTYRCADQDLAHQVLTMPSVCNTLMSGLPVANAARETGLALRVGRISAGKGYA
jgi:hypothetical protein